MWYDNHLHFKQERESIMNICVYCSASELTDEYTEPAKRFITILGQEGHTLVWGGSDRGLMSVIADTAEENGAKLIGVSMESLKNTTRTVADEMIVAEDLSERRTLMIEKSDAFVALVGGTGTLDELTDAFEQKRHTGNNKPIVVLNTNNFYSGLETQWQRMAHDGFLNRLPRPFSELIAFVDEPEDVITKIEEMLGQEARPLAVASAEAV